ncbi:DUF4158 domain-containing protein [Spirillospora sp. NBC_00431]
MKEAGITYSGTGPHRIDTHPDVLFSLRYEGRHPARPPTRGKTSRPSTTGTLGPAPWCPVDSTVALRQDAGDVRSPYERDHVGRDELIRFFALTPADVAFVAPGRGRGPADRLGLAVQLCTLPWLGSMPDDVRSAPRVAVARLAARLSVDPDAPASTDAASRPGLIVCG